MRFLLLLLVASLNLLMSGCTSMQFDKQRDVFRQFEAERARMGMEHMNMENSIAKAIPPAPKVTVLPFDYTPQDVSSYNLNWPGPPRRSLSWGDVKIYKPLVRLDKPSPTDITFFFWVKEDISLWPDKTLGLVWLTIREGETEPSSADVIGPSASGSGKAPKGAPENAIGGFYLGCTKNGKVKGSEGKNGGRANVYIERFDVAYTGGVNVYWDSDTYQSPRHSISCK